MMQLKRCVEYFAGLVGMSVIPTWKLEKLFLVKRIRRIISEFQIDCILDVGANVGQYRDFLRNEVGYKGLIVSFEPDPTNVARLLVAQESDKNWIIQDYALGKESSLLQLNIMRDSEFNSFLKPDNSGTKKYDDSNSVVKEIDVEVKRLDEVVTSLRERRAFTSIFLKMDTQGFDLEVFEGAAGVLDVIWAIQSELSVLPIYKKMPKFEDALSVFKSRGFEISGIYSINESRFPFTEEFDVIFCPNRPWDKNISSTRDLSR